MEVILNLVHRLLFPLEHPLPKKRKLTDLEKYILSHRPDSLEQVEWLQKQYTNGKGKHDHLYY